MPQDINLTSNLDINSYTDVVENTKSCLLASENIPLLRHYIEQIVKPGLILKISDYDKINCSWSFGPGIVCLKTGIFEKLSSECALFISVQRLGILKYMRMDGKTPTNKVWLESIKSKGSQPVLINNNFRRVHESQFSVGDKVVGVCVKKSSELYHVYIGCANVATIHYLAFEGASKKNRPDVKVGDVLYAAIRIADRDIDIELTCIDALGKANGLGVLGRHEPGLVGNAGCQNGGAMLNCSTKLVQSLLNQEEFPLLNTIAQTFSYEIHIGLNGMIWLNCKTNLELQYVANAIMMAEYCSPADALEAARQIG